MTEKSSIVASSERTLHKFTAGSLHYKNRRSSILKNKYGLEPSLDYKEKR